MSLKTHPDNTLTPKIRFFESDYEITKKIIYVFESKELVSFHMDELKLYQNRFLTNFFYNDYFYALKKYSQIFNSNDTQYALNKCSENKINQLHKNLRRKINQICFKKSFTSKMNKASFTKLLNHHYLAYYSNKKTIQKFIKKNNIEKKEITPKLHFLFNTKKRTETANTLYVKNIRSLRTLVHNPKHSIELYKKSFKNIFDKLDDSKKEELPFFVYKNLFYMQKTLFRHGKINDAKKVIRLLISKTDNYSEDLKFDLLWSYLAHNDYNGAFAHVIKKFEIDKKYKTIDNSRLLYWTAQILQRKNKGLAKNIITHLQKNFPLSYYSIISSTSSSSHKKIFQSNDISYNFSINERKNLALIKAFSVNNSKIFLMSEIRKILKTKSVQKERAFSFLMAKSLQENKNYLESFKILYKALEKKTLTLNKDILKLLYPRPYFNLIKKHKHKVDPYIAISLMRQESSFDRQAISSAGAQGLMQLMPKTAKQLDRKVSTTQLANPQVNIKLGMKYLKELNDSYDKNFVYILSSYNAGERNLKKWQERYFFSDSLIKNIENIPFNETQKYVKLIFRNIYFYHLIDKLDGRAPSTNTNNLIAKYLEVKR